MLVTIFLSLFGCAPTPETVSFELTQITRYDVDSFPLQTAVVKDAEGKVIADLPLTYKVRGGKLDASGKTIEPDEEAKIVTVTASHEELSGTYLVALKLPDDLQFANLPANNIVAVGATTQPTVTILSGSEDITSHLPYQCEAEGDSAESVTVSPPCTITGVKEGRVTIRVVSKDNSKSCYMSRSDCGSFDLEVGNEATILARIAKEEAVRIREEQRVEAERIREEQRVEAERIREEKRAAAQAIREEKLAAQCDSCVEKCEAKVKARYERLANNSECDGFFSCVGEGMGSGMAEATDTEACTTKTCKQYCD